MTDEPTIKTDEGRAGGSVGGPVAQGEQADAGAAAMAPRPIGVPTAISADLLRPVPVVLNALMGAFVLMVLSFVVWSAFATVEEATRGEGRVIPARKIQLVQNLEGGIVSALNVREGDRVAPGDVLLRIDPTKATASHGEARERIAGLKILMTRLQAEVERRELVYDDDTAKAHPDLVGRQMEFFHSRAAGLNSALAALKSQEAQREQELIELDAKIATLERSLKLADAELDMLRPLAERRAVSRAELIAAEAKLNETDGALTAARLAVPRVRAQRDEVRQRAAEKLATFRSEALSELTKARVELTALQEANRDNADALARTIVRAPAAGIVKTVNVTTIGQVVKPGSDLVEIVPVDDTLLVEARVAPRDIAFLRPGQPALVKLTAYDFSIYGGLKGELEQIGADSVTNDKGETYYLVRVRTDGTRLQHGDETLPIIPGMVAQVDIMTGEKTILAYLTKPLTRMREDALRER